MRRGFVALLAMAATLASAQSPWQTEDDRTPRLTNPSVPLTYAGGNGSVSFGINSEGETEGQLMGVFGRNDERAVIGQLWWDRTGAGGIQGDYNWLWGATAEEVREDPSRATVARFSFAVVQNGDHNRKASLGFGIERPRYGIDLYLSRGLGGGRSAGSVFEDTVIPISGIDEVGAYTELEITTVETLLERKAYDTEFGLQFSHVFDPFGTRIYGGAGLQDGDGSARAQVYTLGVDTPLGRRGWAMTARAEHQRRDGDFEDDRTDTRLSFYLRYMFGRVFVPSTGQTSPAWVQRAFARPSTAAPRTVDTYVRSAGTRVAGVTHGPREYHNYFPVAQPDSATTSRGTPVSIDVLANDSDPDGQPLLLSAVTQPAHGTAAIQGAVVLYTPEPDFTGMDSFTYTVTDPEGGSATATVTVNVEAPPATNLPPLARNDQATGQAGVTLEIDVLANDVDPDGDVLTLVAAGPAANGITAIVDGRIVYTPLPGFSGSDMFTYTVEDGRGGTATAVVQVIVLPDAAGTNRPPLAGNDFAVTTAGMPVTIPVLDNDYDPDGDPLELVSAGSPANGSVVLAGNAVIYTPQTGFTGTDSFNYSVIDPHGGYAVATVTVRVDQTANNPPVAANDAATVVAGSTATIPVLANDSDPDGDPLAIIAVGTPALGSVTIAGAAIEYSAPASAAGTDSFTYTISDGRGGQATATVTITITAMNTPPVAVDDTVQFASPPMAITVLDNDFDPDGDPLQIISVTQPAFGTATISGDFILYVPVTLPPPGGDSFTYTIADPHGATATATVTITPPIVNSPPVAVDDIAFVQPNVPVMIDVLANDYDPDGEPLEIISVTQPALGTATINGNTIVFVYPVTTANVPTSFTYTIADPHGATATATVAVNPVINQPPVALDDQATTTANIAAQIQVLLNDYDPDGDPIQIEFTTQPLNGVVSFTATSVTYSPNFNYVGEDFFDYTISDGRGGTATARVTVFVNN